MWSALVNLGVLYSRTHRYTEAIDVYTIATRILPQEPAVHLDLGLAYLKQGDYARALPLFEELNRQAPTDHRVKLLLATCQTYDGKPRAAIEQLQPLTTGDSQDEAGTIPTRLGLFSRR